MKLYNKDFYIIGNDNIKNIIQNKKKIIFGASTRIENLLQELQIDADYICDNDGNKWNKKIFGIDIFSPEKLAKEDKNNIVVFTVLTDYKMLIKQFRKIEVEEYYFYGDICEEYLDMFVYNHVFDCNYHYKKFKYIHIFLDEKFIYNFIEMLEENFKIEEHFFFIQNTNLSNKNDIYNNWEKYKIMKLKYNNVLVLDDNYNFKLRDNYNIIKEIESILHTSKRIIFHSGIISNPVIKYFGEHKDLLKEKSTWIIWGADAYLDANDKRVTEVLKYISVVYTAGNEQYEKVGLKYNMENYSYYDFKVNYTYISKEKIKIMQGLQQEKKKNECLNILLGHSGSQLGNHKEGIKQLEKFRNENIKIYCPLSYGEKNYIKSIEEYGCEIFGDKFIPMHDYMSFNNYIEFLSTIDIAVMPFNRGMAVNNIYILLYFGKKVYIKSECDVFKYFCKLNYKIENFHNIQNEEIIQFVKNENKQINKNQSEKIFDINIVRMNWNKLFENDI